MSDLQSTSEESMTSPLSTARPVQRLGGQQWLDGLRTAKSRSQEDICFEERSAPFRPCESGDFNGQHVLRVPKDQAHAHKHPQKPQRHKTQNGLTSTGHHHVNGTQRASHIPKCQYDFVSMESDRTHYIPEGGFYLPAFDQRSVSAPRREFSSSFENIYDRVNLVAEVPPLTRIERDRYQQMRQEYLRSKKRELLGGSRHAVTPPPAYFRSVHHEDITPRQGVPRQARLDVNNQQEPSAFTAVTSRHSPSSDSRIKLRRTAQDVAPPSGAPSSGSDNYGPCYFALGYKQADDTSSPNNKTSQPDSQTSMPAKPTRQPDSQTRQPDIQTMQPDCQTSQPASQTSMPARLTRQPDSQTWQPANQTIQPGRQTRQPDIQTRQPDSLIRQPDRQTRQPDSLIRQPDSVIRQPDRQTDIQTRQPDSLIRQPDRQTRQPDSQTWQPDIQTRQPDRQTWQPDIQTRHPDSQTWHPDIQTRQPDSQTWQPDSQTRQPDSQTWQPDSQTRQPDRQTWQPATQTWQPDKHKRQPDSLIGKPTSQTSQSAIWTWQPDNRASQPDSLISEQASQKKQSDSLKRQPDRQTWQPSTQTSQPDTQISQPDSHTRQLACRGDQLRSSPSPYPGCEQDMAGVPGQVVTDNGPQLRHGKETSSPDSGESDKQTLDAKQLMMEEGERYTKYKADYLRQRSGQGSSVSSGDEQRARSREGRPLIPPDEYEYVLRRRMPDQHQQQVAGATGPQDHQAQTRYKYPPEAVVKMPSSDGTTRSIEHVEPRTLPQALRQVKQSSQNQKVVNDQRKDNVASRPYIISPKPRRGSSPTQPTNPPVQSNVSPPTNGTFAQKMHQYNSETRQQYPSTSTQLDREYNYDYWRSFAKSTQRTPNQHISSPSENGKHSIDKEAVQIKRHESRSSDPRPVVAQLSHSGRAVPTTRKQQQYNDDWERPISRSHPSQGRVKITNPAQKTRSDVGCDPSKWPNLLHGHKEADSVPRPGSSDYRQTVSDSTDGDVPRVASDRFESYVRERRRDYKAQNSAEISSGGETCSSTGHVDGSWQKKHRVSSGAEPVSSSPEDRNASFPRSASDSSETNRKPMASTAQQRVTVPRPVGMSHSDGNSGEVAPTVASIKAALYGEVDSGLPQVTSTSQPRWENAPSNTAGSVANGRPNCFQFVPARRYDDDSDDDVRLINYASFRDGPRRKRPNINDALTELEEAYERLDLDNEYLLDRATRRDYPRLVAPDNGWQSNVKRLSITNVKKLDEIQQRVENPSLEYAKRWLSSESGLTVSKNGPDTTTITPPVQATSPPRGPRASSLPRKFGDDMAVRKYRRSNSGRTAGSHVTSPPTSYIGYSPSLTPAPSVDSISRRSHAGRARSPDVVVQRAGSEVDYLVDRTPNHVRLARPASEADIYHDDVAYRQLRRDVAPVTCRLRPRSQSVERPVERQLLQERRNSVGVSTDGGRPFDRHKSLSHGVASMVELFSMRASLSAPDLSDKSVFSGQYDCRGDLVTDDPKYSKYALPPRTHQTPRIVKQRHEMRSRLRQANSVAAETATDASRGHRSPPDGALDSNEMIITKVSDAIESQQSVTDDVGRYKVQMTARKTPEALSTPTTGKIEWCKLDEPLMSEPGRVKMVTIPVKVNASQRCPAVPANTPSSVMLNASQRCPAVPANTTGSVMSNASQRCPAVPANTTGSVMLNASQRCPAVPANTTGSVMLNASQRCPAVPASITATSTTGTRSWTALPDSANAAALDYKTKAAELDRRLNQLKATLNQTVSTPPGVIHTATPAAGGIHTATPTGGIRSAFTACGTRQLEPVITTTDCGSRAQIGVPSCTTSRMNNTYGESTYVPTPAVADTRVTVVRQQAPMRRIEVAPASRPISATSVGPSDRSWSGVSPYGGDVYRRRQTSRNELSDGEMTDATDTTLDILVRRNVRSSSADTLDFSCSELDVASVTSCDEDLERLRELCRSAGNTTWTQPIGVFSGASFTSNSTKSVVTESVSSNVVMRTRTEEVVQRGSKVERTPSFKELVHSFEEQSSAFMRAPVRLNNAAVAQCDI